MARTPRNSLKKHDVHASSRASKARRERALTQVRKDKRREAVQAKRRRLMSTEDVPTSGRDIHELVTVLAGSTENAGAGVGAQERYTALKEIRAMLSASESDFAKVEAIIESGIVPVLVTLLESASPLATSTRSGGEVYKEILWCLTNIASGQYEHTKLVLPAVPRLLQFLEGSNHTLAEHAAWVLGNIAADCDEFRQQLIKNGAIVPLVHLLANPAEKDLVKNCAWALSNLARGHNSSAQPFLDAGIFPIIAARLPANQAQSFNEETVVEIAWLLSFLTAREESCLKQMLEGGLVELLLPYFATTNELLLTPILRVFGNICCGSMDRHTDDWQAPFVRRLLAPDSVFIPKLVELLQPSTAESFAHLTSESAWVLSNLATFDRQAIDILMQAGVLPLLGQQFHNGTFETRREVAFALTNIALTSPTHLEQVMALDVLKDFMQLLSAADVAVVGNSLRLVEYVLRSAPNGVMTVESHGGIEALENVQFQCQEAHLAQWAEALVNEFYGENYGVNSPTSAGAIGGLVPELPVFQFPPQETAGRGRGAHMTTPAWKK